jgi:hypothetical protein
MKAMEGPKENPYPTDSYDDRTPNPPHELGDSQINELHATTLLELDPASAHKAPVELDATD